MPSLQEIREFNSRLIAMGNEREVVRAWGEEVEDVEVPRNGLDADLSSLLSDSDDLFPGRESEPAFDVLESLSGDDRTDFDDVVFDDDEPTPPPAPGETADEDEPFDFDALADFGEPDDPGDSADLEDLFGPDEAAAPDEAAPLDDVPPWDDAEPSAPPAPSAPDEGDFSDFEALLRDTDFGQAEDEDQDDDQDEDQPAVSVEAEEAGGTGELEDLEGVEDLDGLDTEFDAFADESPATEEIAAPSAALDLLGESDTDDQLSGLDEGSDLDGIGDLDEAGFDGLSGFEFSDEEPQEATGAGRPAARTPSGADFGFEEPIVPGAEDRFGDLDDVGEDDLDEFSLGDFGEQFGVLDESASDEDLNPAINLPELSAGIARPAGAAAEFQLSDSEFARMRAGLASLPLNVRQEVQRIIAEGRGSGRDQEKLCRMLVAGGGAQEIANAAGRVTGKRIRIPRGYEKQTGEQFETQRASFAYQFRENVWPIMRLALVFIVAAGLLALAGYNLVFRPLYARSLYVQGLELIEADQHSLANQTFARAWRVWPNDRWYYEYADAFVQARQYSLAQQKYEELVFGRVPEVRDLARSALQDRAYGAIVSNHRPPRQGLLAWANLESEILGNYGRAEQLLDLMLYSDLNDYDARLAHGDNYMRWAESQPARFEDARLAYARLIERHGQTDELLFRMLRYFIATANLREVVTLKDAFQADRRVRVDAEAYAMLAGYLIDNGLMSDVESVAFRALDVDSTIPELHYHLARYYRASRAFGEEELALATARRLLTGAIPFSTARRRMLADTHTRIGENYAAAGRYLDAQESFTAAIRLYEEGRRRGILGTDALLARAYARLGDIYYYVAREYEQALAQFDRAEAAGYRSPDLDYKQGFVHYRAGRVEEALREFRQAALDPSAATNALLWATANTHYRRRNFFAAEAYYRELLERVQRERAAIRTLLVDEDPRHQSVIEYLYRGYNNLGVTLHRLYEESGEPARYTQSLVHLTRSTEIATNYRRDPRTLVRTESVDLAFLNQREALYPRPQFEMQIYNEIPEDLDDLVF